MYVIMNKILLLIVWILFIVPVSAYNVTLHYNWITEVIEVNWSESIILDWSWSENNDYYTYNSSYDYTDIYYYDSYWRYKIERTIGDVYLNWDYNKSFTWNQYTLLSSDLFCDNTWNIIIFTWSDIPVRVESSTWNVFSNFWDNALAIIYWNIPWFITGAVILFLIFFLIRLFIPKNRR